MRLVVADLEQFRRAASYISNLSIIVVIGAWAMSLFFPWQHPLADIASPIFLGLAIVAKFATRDGRPISARTVRLLELVGGANLLFAMLVTVYQSVRGGIHDIDLVGLAIDIASIVAIGVIFRKNISAAKSLVSST